MPTLGNYQHAQVVVPSNTANLRYVAQALSFTDASGGLSTATIYIDTPGGETNVPITLPAGLWQIPATKVYLTGTTATNIVEYWNS